MIRSCPALPDTALHSPCAAAVEHSLHLCGALPITALLSGVTQLACGGRPGVGAQVVCLASLSAEVWSKQVNVNSWSEQNPASQSAVAETVVCVSRPHLNQSSITNAWYHLGLSSLLFVLVRAFCLCSTSILARLGRFICRSQPHGATGEQSMLLCRKLPGAGAAQAWVWAAPGVGV